MTREDKQLLLKDLCARLPHGVVIEITSDGGMVEASYDMRLDAGLLADLLHSEDDFKPYLRPISSMTDEEMDKLFDILKIDKDGKDEDWIKINDVLGIEFFFPTGKWVENVAEAYDYLYSIHIDFRGLIPMGLALESPDGMYKTK